MKTLLVFLFLAGTTFGATPPNIVFLLADDMGYGDLGCYGNPVIKSPHLDRLASEGMRLLDCYAASPNCSPARTAILTGRSPYRVGMYDFARFAPMHIPKDELTVAEVLQGAGYQTMFGGKWHCSGTFEKQPHPGDHGFDHWLAHPKNFGKDPAGFHRNGEALPKLDGWMSEIVVNEAMEFIGKRDTSKPFMTMLWFSEPHTPVVAAPEFVAMYENKASEQAAATLKFGGPRVNRKRARENLKATYFGCVTMLDHHIGRLLDFLRDNGLEEDTLVVFTSDNGPEHRTTTAFGSPGDLRGAKGHIHEGGYRVPGIIKWPGRIGAGTTSRVPVNGTDFLPSLAAAAGATFTTPKPLDGTDVFPALRGGEASRAKPMLWWLYHARGGKEVSMRHGDYKLLANMLPQRKIDGNDASPPQGQSIMDFIKQAELGNFTLYNLKDDPGETGELSQVEPGKFEEMKRAMIDLHAEIRSEGPVYELGRQKK